MNRVLLPLLKYKGMANLLSGSYHSFFKSQNINPVDLKEYSLGDDVRYIDWNATARNSVPLIKHSLEEKEIAISFLLHTNTSMKFGSFDNSPWNLSKITLFLMFHSIMKNKDKLTLWLTSEENPIITNYFHQQTDASILKELQQLEISNSKSYQFLNKNLFFKKKQQAFFILSDIFLPLHYLEWFKTLPPNVKKGVFLYSHDFTDIKKNPVFGFKDSVKNTIISSSRPEAMIKKAEKAQQQKIEDFHKMQTIYHYKLLEINSFDTLLGSLINYLKWAI